MIPARPHFPYSPCPAPDSSSACASARRVVLGPGSKAGKRVRFARCRRESFPGLDPGSRAVCARAGRAVLGPGAGARVTVSAGFGGGDTRWVSFRRKPESDTVCINTRRVVLGPGSKAGKRVRFARCRRESFPGLDPGSRAVCARAGRAVLGPGAGARVTVLAGFGGGDTRWASFRRKPESITRRSAQKKPGA